MYHKPHNHQNNISTITRSHEINLFSRCCCKNEATQRGFRLWYLVRMNCLDPIYSLHVNIPRFPSYLAPVGPISVRDFSFSSFSVDFLRNYPIWWKTQCPAPDQGDSLFNAGNFLMRKPVLPPLSRNANFFQKTFISFLYTSWWPWRLSKGIFGHLLCAWVVFQSIFRLIAHVHRTTVNEIGVENDSYEFLNRKKSLVYHSGSKEVVLISKFSAENSYRPLRFNTVRHIKTCPSVCVLP